MTPRSREQVFNTILRDMLQNKHPLWKEISAEQTRVIAGSSQKTPDILLAVSKQTPIIIETEFMPANTVESDAKDRLGNVLEHDNRVIECVIALRIPESVSFTPQHELNSVIANTQYSFCVFFKKENGKNARWPESGWLNGGINDIADCIESVQLTESLIIKSSNVLEKGVSRASNILTEAPPSTLKNIAMQLCQEESEQTFRMAIAIIANALVFHKQIEGRQNIPLLSSLTGEISGLIDYKVVECWKWIIVTVNYWPIFKIAADLLSAIPTIQSKGILDCLHQTAGELSALGATELNDLSGRMFQTLIADRKFLATFYTLPISATLLAELVAFRLQIDWNDSEAVKSLRIGDLACGTGTLIGAMYRSIVSRFRRAGNNGQNIHAEMLENSLYAFDIMPAATHLTSSTLSSVHPEIPFVGTKIVTMPYGKSEGCMPSIGSLELLEDVRVHSLLSLGRQPLLGINTEKSSMPNPNGALQLKLNAEASHDVDVPHDFFDIVIMNPPFTRPTNHEVSDVPVPSFAGFGTSKDEQVAMSSRLSVLRNSIDEPAGSGNAGLASNFIDLGHVKLKAGGVLGLVLPATFVQGQAWEDARKLIQRHYKNVSIISISSTGSTEQAFSADTGMAEVLVVAERMCVNPKENNAMPESTTFQFVNLAHRPFHHMEAIWLARSISNYDRTVISGKIEVGEANYQGNIIHAGSFVGGCAGLHEPNLGQFMIELLNGKFFATRTHRSEPIPLTALGNLGQRGLLSRDLTGKGSRGAFDKSELAPGRFPVYPCLWAHNAEAERQFYVEPDCELLIREGKRERALNIWNDMTSKLHLNINFRLNSQSLAACLTSEESLGGDAWPNFVLDNPEFEKLVTLWFNSTLGLMVHWWFGTKQQIGRSRVSISRLPQLTTLDIRKLTESTIEQANLIFESFQDKKFLPANESYCDENRIELDRALIVNVLGLPEEFVEEYDLVRKQWCAEPRVHGGKSTSLQA